MVSTLATAAGKPLDPKPFYWALFIVAILMAIWLTLAFVGKQRTHNTPLWQRWFPVTMTSSVQTAIPVNVRSVEGSSNNIVETESGLYFLTGDAFVSATGEKVVIKANERWDLYLCAQSGERCNTIHSFCENLKWTELMRDAQGRIEGCYAPHLGSGSSSASVAAITVPPEDRAGRKGGRAKVTPAIGITHPREWAWRMGLPKAAEAH